MPKRAELHNHLGAAVDPPIMWAIAHEQGIRLPFKNYWDFEDLITIDFEEHYNTVAQVDKELFHWTELIQSSPSAVEMSVKTIFGGGYRKCNITTHEVRFNPMKRNRGGEQDLDHIIMAALRGMDKAVLEYSQVKAGLILMMDRTFTPQLNEIILNKALKYQNRGIVGIDLAGPQSKKFKLKNYIKLFNIAKKKGLGITMHTGEEGNIKEMKEVVKYIVPDRIGHGFLAYKDHDLMKELKRKKITLELCPTSNLKCGVIESVELMKKIYQTLYKNGLQLTINTDGPEMYKTNIYKEQELTIDHEIFTKKQINEFMKNSFQATFIK